MMRWLQLTNYHWTGRQLFLPIHRMKQKKCEVNGMGTWLGGRISKSESPTLPHAGQ